MNWKKALLVVVLGLFALVFFTVAAAGILATAGLTAAAVAISESGVVQAFEEVADGADRLQIEVDENSVTFTNPDTGESRSIVAEERFGRGSVSFNLPEVTITDADGESRVIVPGLRGTAEVDVPEVSITDAVGTGPDSGQSRVIIPDVVRPNLDVRVPRVVWEDGHDWTYSVDRWFGNDFGVRLVSQLFQAMFTLVALVLIAVGVVILLRNRRQAKVEDKLEKTA